MAAQSDAGSTPSAAEIDAIASRSFSTSFRGWDPDAVRVHLVNVAEMVRSLMHRQTDLERRLAEAEAAARRADLTQLDPDEVDQVLGEETARVLRTARESAAEITQKATEQAELLVRQAADDAARARTQIAVDSEHERAEATETAAAIRSAGEAHIAELQAAGEAELAELRAELEAEIAQAGQTARDEGAELIAGAEDTASTIRQEATEEAEAVRAEADSYAAQQRAEVDAEIASKRTQSDEELGVLTERAREQVAEAERMRERVLADLSRRRKAARQHLEQLQAGRERLLAAYDVIRTTTEQATDELGVVLSDAKRAADDAARRVAGEPTPDADEMLAELDLARAADLPIIAASEPDDALELKSSEPIEPTGPGEEADPTEPSDPSEEAEEDTSHPETALAATVEPAPADEKAPAEDAVTPLEGDDLAVGGARTPSDEKSNGRHRQTRRAKRRGHDPLGGESLPDVPMEPIEGAAEFEQVRVVSAGGDVETVAGVSKTVPTSGAERALASVARTKTAATAPASEPSEEPDDEQSGTPAEKRRELAETTATASDPTAIADEVAGIFDRLRAVQPVEATTPETPDGASPSASDTAAEQPTTPSIQTADVQEQATVGPVHDSDRLVALFERRDASVEEVGRRLAKHLKRSLSDHQSELLDELRRASRIGSPEEVLGASGEFCADWKTVADRDLAGAVAAGALLAGDVCEGASERVDVDLTVVIADLIEAIGAPLYQRLARVLGENDDGESDDSEVADPSTLDERELADRVRACYREWRGARLTAAVTDACARSFGEGIRSALPEDVGLRWYCGPGDDPCSDCNDNQLAGVVEPGETFPTGQLTAPAHPGCRCLALPMLEELSPS